MPLPGTSRIRDTSNDAFRLTVDYVKQEALGPVKRTGRFVGYGLAATVLWSMGVILLLVGILRLLQTETSALTGNLSWVPYLVITFLALLVLGIAAWRITKGPAVLRAPAVEARQAARADAPPATRSTAPASEGGTTP